MLVASATHPAMLTYLNNAESTKDYPNENYGRELLELHSVGVDAGSVSSIFPGISQERLGVVRPR
jgi:uncharacterized protein (DUF1800 family)